jgi:hypothetical protein
MHVSADMHQAKIRLQAAAEPFLKDDYMGSMGIVYLQSGKRQCSTDRPQLVKPALRRRYVRAQTRPW